MILTCPDCASRYFIDDQLIGPGGKTVRCSSCGASWKAHRDEAPLDLTSSPEEGAVGLPPRTEEAAAPGETSGGEPTTGNLPGAFRAKAEERRRVLQAAAAGAVWAAIGAVVLLVVGALLIFRTDVVRMLPKAASAYARIGLPVNTTGINIEKVEAAPGLQDGRAAVVVTGALRNIEKNAVVAPSLRINLLNKSGRIVQSKIAAPTDPDIPAGETRHFTITLLDPPSSATDVEVVFEAVSTPPSPHKPAAGSSAPMPKLRPAALPGPAEPRDAMPGPPPTPPAGHVEEAKPIEDGSYGLPKAHE